MADPEVWLRGPIPGVIALLQPVAHALVQCRVEARAVLTGLTAAQLADRPGGVACMDYHARHAMGSLDRLLAYARGAQLDEAQRAWLASESSPSGRDGDELAAAFEGAVDRAILQLRTIREAELLQPREVGRARLPSNVLGLVFHAAEHTQRHVGQMTTTAKLVRSARQA